MRTKRDGVERVQGAWGAATRKLADWGLVSPRLMLAGGGLFMTLSNWGLLPSVRPHSQESRLLPSSPYFDGITNCPACKQRTVVLAHC